MNNEANPSGSRSIVTVFGLNLLGLNPQPTSFGVTLWNIRPMRPDGLMGFCTLVGSHLLEQCGLVGHLVLVSVLEALLLHLLPVRLQLAVGTFGLQTCESVGGGSDNSVQLRFCLSSSLP